MSGTVADFIGLLQARLGKPYSETIDGGVGPNYYDCSGLVEVCLNAIGIPFTRNTYSQWADPRYGHLPADAPMLIGDLLYFHVDGEADPGHVGVYVGNGRYLNAPHTGAFVRIDAIPNGPGMYVLGIIRPPFGTASPNPPPKPPAQLLKELDEMDSVITSGGDIVSHAMGKPGTAADGHYFEITRKAGTQGQPPTPQNTSIIDMTATWAFFQVGG